MFKLNMYWGCFSIIFGVICKCIIEAATWTICLLWIIYFFFSSILTFVGDEGGLDFAKVVENRHSFQFECIDHPGFSRVQFL